MSPYEPALNTTESPTERVKRQLDLTLATAAQNGLAVIGFMIIPDGTAEPFASGVELRPEEFRRFVEILTEAMTEKET